MNRIPTVVFPKRYTETTLGANKGALPSSSPQKHQEHSEASRVLRALSDPLVYRVCFAKRLERKKNDESDIFLLRFVFLRVRLLKKESRISSYEQLLAGSCPPRR